VTNGDFSVRWTGFIKPSRTDTYTFYTTVHAATNTGTNERVQLWIDNSLVIAQWTSLATVDPSGTLSFPVAEDYYNLVMDYTRLLGTNTRYVFNFKCQTVKNRMKRRMGGPDGAEDFECPVLWVKVKEGRRQELYSGFTDTTFFSPFYCSSVL
jgi:hypothetical protein